MFSLYLLATPSCVIISVANYTFTIIEKLKKCFHCDYTKMKENIVDIINNAVNNVGS